MVSYLYMSDERFWGEWEGCSILVAAIGEDSLMLILRFMIPTNVMKMFSTFFSPFTVCGLFPHVKPCPS
jgi:hypothetical protein